MIWPTNSKRPMRISRYIKKEKNKNNKALIITWYCRQSTVSYLPLILIHRVSFLTNPLHLFLSLSQVLQQEVVQLGAKINKKIKKNLSQVLQQELVALEALLMDQRGLNEELAASLAEVLCIYIYVHLRIYIQTHTYTHTHTHTHLLTHTSRERERDRQRETDRDRP
jgi:hypothetical protein